MTGAKDMTTGRLELKNLSRTERIILLAVRMLEARGALKPDHLWMQKVVFLFRRLMESMDSREGPNASGFIAYDFGPYSEEVEGALEALNKDAILRTLPNKTFALTPMGERLSGQLVESKGQAVGAMESILGILEDLSSNELILYVYATSPEWARASKVQHVLTDQTARLALARKLYKKGKVSAERAAEVAGIGLERFLSSAA